MVIFEPPSYGGGDTLRIASLGSCRVRNPIYVLRDRGDLRVCDAGLAATHTAAEALQTLQLVTGEITIADDLAPYVFETAATPPIQRLARTLDGGVDVFLLEVSGDKQFVVDGVCLQQNFVSRNLVQAHRGAMLAWYREVCAGRPVAEELIEATLTRLREGGFRHDAHMANLLRGLRLEHPDSADLDQTLGEMMGKAGGRWVVIGSITVPGLDGATMRERRALNARLEGVARGRGAVFFDPTRLIEDHGREIALDEDGANINEYAEAFYPVVGETWVSLARTGRPPGRRDFDTTAARGAESGSGKAVTDRWALADRVDSELRNLYAERLGALGLEASGLYAHYRTRLEQNLLIGQRERAAFSLITEYLPNYDAYGVMRAGVGELALLLAASGRRVTAYEPNPNRRGAILAGAVRLRQAGLLADGLFDASAELTPGAPLTGQVLGIGLDVTQVRTELSAAPHVENSRAFAALLIDPRLFVRLRESAAEQEDLALSLAGKGFGRRRDYPAEGLFWFRKTPIEPPEQSSTPPTVAHHGLKAPV